MSGTALDRLRAAATAREAAGLRRALWSRSPDFGGMLDLASNDYLGLCGDPRLAAAASAAAAEWGTGATGSRLVTGTTTLHDQLEERLARFTGAAGALVFSSGYLANLAVVTAVSSALATQSQGVLIVSDERNHASLIDACRLARTQSVRLAIAPHGDVAAIRGLLAARAEESALVVSDAVFSVDGALAPVAALHAAAREHGALLVLDEAHALGVLGPGGAGASARAGLAAEPDLIRTVTLSKSLASQGGAVLAAPEVVATVVDTGRGFIFDTGLAPPSAAAALAALDVVAAEPRRGEAALASAARLAKIAADLGLTVVPPDAAVLAVVIGDPHAAVAAREICRREGVRAGCFRPPSVPAGRACLRLTARATMSEGDFAIAARALACVRDHVGVDVHLPFRQ
ncbi:MAG TPA: aminotransferase class I/II-fold pyridoxal phosphate-dependent enzyme [Streptosporangiaceae bacterium]